MTLERLSVLQTLAEDDDAFHTNVIIDEDAEPEKNTYQYNIISIPWDDRTKKSKVGIVVLQVTILIAIIAGVVNMFVMQYSGFSSTSVWRQPINCRRVKIEDFMYVTRIHSAATQQLLCIAALVEHGVVLADNECVKENDDVVLRAGNPLSIECHNAFKLEFLKTYTDNGYAIAMLKVVGDIQNCASPISVGSSLDTTIPFFTVGSPQQNGRSLLWQPLIMAPLENCSKIDPSVNVGQPICMKRFGTCPLNPGDLLVQNDRLQGLALSKTMGTTSNSQTFMIYFAKIGFISELLKVIKKF